MAVTLGWLSLPATLASARKRPRAAASAARWSARTLMATSRSMVGSCAFRTTPMPPCPSTPVTLYFPRDLPTQAWDAELRLAGGGASDEVSTGKTAVWSCLDASEGLSRFVGVRTSCGFSGVKVWLRGGVTSSHLATSITSAGTRREIMHPLRIHLALAASLTLTAFAAAQADALPEGAVARLGTNRFRGEGHSIYPVLSGDGKLLAAAGPDVIHLLDPASGKEVRRVQKGASPDSFREGS